MRMPTLTFRIKVTMMLAGVVLLLGVAALTQARLDMRRILGDELEIRGEAIAKDLSTNSTDLVLTGDLVGLYNLVNRAKMNNRDVRYILIIGQSGEVLVNTFGSGVPRGLLEANVLPPEQDVQLRRLQTEEGLIRDFAVPNFGGRAGTVRVGMSDQGVEAAVAYNSRHLVILVAVAVALGLMISYWLSYYLTRPLSHLLSAVQSVARGDLSHRIVSAGGDEVGRLGSAFNVMARELEAKEAARSDLLDKIISSQEEERKRVARELHDELAQRLTSVLFSLEAVDDALADSDEERKQVIRRAREVTESSLAETRKLIADLRPTVLDDLGLVPAIRSYAEGRLRPNNTEVIVNAADIPDPLPPAVETAVFRIFQEAVSNVAKHAKATQARIALRADNGMLCGGVEDDGQGFQQTPAEAFAGSLEVGLGIRGMEERAALLGGTLQVVSQEGRGTAVYFSIPL